MAFRIRMAVTELVIQVGGTAVVIVGGEIHDKQPSKETASR